MAVVDYAANRVYFATSSPSATLFALDMGPSRGAFLHAQRTAVEPQTAELAGQRLTPSCGWPHLHRYRRRQGPQLPPD